MNKKWFTIAVSLSLILVCIGMAVQPVVAKNHCSVPTKLILVRHGQTPWNVSGLLQGTADVPLDAAGQAQAQQAALAIAGKDVDAVYSSPLSRAYDTALAIAAPHGLSVNKRGNLREIGVGMYTGYKAAQIPVDIRTAWGTNPDYPLPSGVPDPAGLLDPQYVEGIWFEGESLNMVLERSWHAGLQNLAKQHCGENVVIATHGGIIQIALTQVYGIPVTKYTTFKIGNASQTVLEFAPDGSVSVLPTW